MRKGEGGGEEEDGGRRGGRRKGHMSVSSWLPTHFSVPSTVSGGQEGWSHHHHLHSGWYDLLRDEGYLRGLQGNH